MDQASVFKASLVVISRSLFFLFFTLLIFLLNLAILASIRLDLFGGCSSWGAPQIRSIGTRCSTDSSLASEATSFSAILSASLFMDLIFFLLNLALVLSDALIILSFKASIWDFKLSISASRLLNFLASLESLFCLPFSCLLVRGLLIPWSGGPRPLGSKLIIYRFPSRHLWRQQRRSVGCPLWLPTLKRSLVILNKFD